MRSGNCKLIAAVALAVGVSACGQQPPQGADALVAASAPATNASDSGTPKPRVTGKPGRNANFTGPAGQDEVRPADARSFWSSLMFARTAPTSARPGISQAEAIARYKRDSATGGAHSAEIPQVYLGTFTHRSGSGRGVDVLDRLAWVISLPSDPITGPDGQKHDGCSDNFVLDANTGEILLDSRDCTS